MSDKSEKKEDIYVHLARDTVETYVKTKKKLKISESIPEKLLTERAGAFTTLYKQGRLRGCIGTIFPTTKNIAEEIIQNAISACSRDPRFLPVENDELPYIEYSVDIMGVPESIDSQSQLDVKRYGVIVSCGNRRGLLLPDLEGVEIGRASCRERV